MDSIGVNVIRKSSAARSREARRNAVSILGSAVSMKVLAGNSKVLVDDSKGSKTAVRCKR